MWRMREGERFPSLDGNGRKFGKGRRRKTNGYLKNWVKTLNKGKKLANSREMFKPKPCINLQLGETLCISNFKHDTGVFGCGRANTIIRFQVPFSYSKSWDKLNQSSKAVSFDWPYLFVQWTQFLEELKSIHDYIKVSFQDSMASEWTRLGKLLDVTFGSLCRA